MSISRKYIFPVVMLIGISNAGASGFALHEQNASGLGNAFAGAGAVAEDASTVFFNPAGMSYLPGKQLVIVGDFIGLSTRFSNTQSTAAPFQPLGGNGGNAGSWAVVPSGYFSYQINPRLWLGMGINAPFGLKTEYDSTWMGRFHGIKSELTTYNFNPSIAFKLNDWLTIGAGVNYQRATAELTNAVNYSALAFGSPLFSRVGPDHSGTAKLEGSDGGWGFNLGTLFNVNPNTRIGLTYRSSIKYTLSGDLSFSDVPAAFGLSEAASAAVANSTATADLKVPPSASISLFHKFNPKWDFMVGVSWTGWSTFQELKVVRDNGVILSTTEENWDDTWRVGVGVNYHPDRQWTWRLGFAYDQSPVKDRYRTPRIPDQDRYWVAVGAQYQITSKDTIDFGYAHLFVPDASINQTAPGAGNLVGTYDSEVDIIGLQYRRVF